jgi:hypothetical protein
LLSFLDRVNMSRRERQRRKPEGSTYKEYKQRNLELVALETEILFESIEPSSVGAVRWYGLSVLMRHDLQVGYVVTEIPSNIALKPCRVNTVRLVIA